MSHSIRMPQHLKACDKPNDVAHPPGYTVDRLWREMQHEQQVARTFAQMKLLRQMQRQ